MLLLQPAPFSYFHPIFVVISIPLHTPHNTTQHTTQHTPTSSSSCLGGLSLLCRMAQILCIGGASDSAAVQTVRTHIVRGASASVQTSSIDAFTATCSASPSFDGIVSVADAAQHDAAFLANALVALKPNGKLVLHEPSVCVARL
jgi:hypothetical protein